MLREHVRKARLRARIAAPDAPELPAAPAAPRRAAASNAPAPAPTGDPARIGRLHAVADGTPWVVAPGWLEEPARALLAAPAPGGALEALVGRRVVLVALDSDEARVAILGWVEESPPAGPVRRLEVDGERVVIAARESLELRCGEAAITLDADGRVKIRGKAVLSHAREVNRIRGGQVRIN